MDFLGNDGALGLTSDQTDKVLQFQDLTGIEDISVCRDVLQRHQWNLEVAVQEQLNMREGRPSMYALETRPPQVVSDHLIAQHVYYAPSDGTGGGLRSLLGFFWNLCYSTLMSLLQFTRLMIRGRPAEPQVDPMEEVAQFIREYEERYTSDHPVFYRGTFAHALNDAKRELRFLLVYLHDFAQTDSELFARNVLGDHSVRQYVDAHFLTWGCTRSSQEGGRAAMSCRAGSTTPWSGVLVLRDGGKMGVVGHVHGRLDAQSFLQKLHGIVSDFEGGLSRARADRLEQSINRSLRAHQDEAFLESLRADQEKERRREEERRLEQLERDREAAEIRAEEERRMSIAREKIESVDRVPAEPDAQHPDAVHVVFKLPSGQRLDRRFLKSHSLEHVFYFVFCHPNAPDTFEITTNFPKRVLYNRSVASNARIQTLEEAGLKNREMLFINDLDA